ncbi:MAG: type II toxin-antitoxin system VapC family toxin [Candidatus Korobacteraceae bacterium]
MLVLDTHVLIWMLGDSAKISANAHRAIQDARRNGVIAIADISLWELAWVAENRRIRISGTVEGFIREATARLVVKPATPEIAALAARLPAPYPRDPMDRLIGATAVVEGAYLVTADQRIRDSQVVPTLW